MLILVEGFDQNGNKIIEYIEHNLSIDKLLTNILNRLYNDRDINNNQYYSMYDQINKQDYQSTLRFLKKRFRKDYDEVIQIWENGVYK